MQQYELEIKDGVHVVKTPSWKGMVSYIQDVLSNYRAYIYRGQREPDWKLIPSEERDGNENILRIDILETFKNACRGRRGQAPIVLTDDQWWALGQHHGLKTPLLDWTESPFVATFFAFATAREPEKLPKERMLYAIAKQLIIKMTEEEKKINPGTLLTGTDGIEIISPLVDDNNRLVSQRGIFTKALRYNIDIEEWIRKRSKGSTKGIMIKIYITENIGDRSAFLRFLNQMNINYLSLFPDIDGSSKYCNMKLEIDDY